MAASETLRTRLLSSQPSSNKCIFYDQKKFFLQNEYIFKKDLYFICNTNIFCVKIYFWNEIKICSKHSDKTQFLKKFPSGKINGTNNALFFFGELQLITVLLLNCDSYMNWSSRFVPLKVCVEFSIFDSVWFLLKFIFLFNKMHADSLTLKEHSEVWDYFRQLKAL